MAMLTYAFETFSERKPPMNPMSSLQIFLCKRSVIYSMPSVASRSKYQFKVFSINYLFANTRNLSPSPFRNLVHLFLVLFIPWLFLHFSSLPKFFLPSYRPRALTDCSLTVLLGAKWKLVHRIIICRRSFMLGWLDGWLHHKKAKRTNSQTLCYTPKVPKLRRRWVMNLGESIVKVPSKMRLVVWQTCIESCIGRCETITESLTRF